MNKPVSYSSLFYLLMLIFTVHTTATAQENLVPNGSFEQYDSCPNSLTEITRAKCWYNGNQGTADYYNSCAPVSGGASVPNNGFGFQYAYNGNAYAGIVIISDTNTNYREYLKVKLNNPLEKGQLYRISLYAVVVGPYIGFGGVSKVGFLFINDSMPANGVAPIYDSNAVYAYQSLTDTVNWVKCSTSYQAKENYNYMVIGDFSEYDSNSLLLINNSFPCNQSYIYIDCVSVTEQQVFIPNVFTPNNDGINDVFKIQGLPQNSTIKVYNRWGNVVFESNNANKEFWNGKYKGKKVSDGVYFYIISNKNLNKTGFIQLLN